MTKMQKRLFRIGELAKKLSIETSVIRFWEKEFELSCHRSDGQQRFYSERDLEKFYTIKELLYNKKFTIAGAKEELKKSKSKQPLEKVDDNTKIIPSKLEREILKLQDQLIKLRELL